MADHIISTSFIHFYSLINFLLFLSFQSYYDEVHNKQPAFDSVSDKTQLLLQSTADSRITSQLTQLNSRYTQLHAYTKVSL